MHIGIDLGTTFCCVAFIHEGIPKTIPDSKGRELTPSVVWFDGSSAYVGEEGNKRKLTPFSPVYEFFKRDMGKPVEESPGKTEIAPYEIKGTKYGAAGISAILLRKLKRDAWQYFRKLKLIDENIKEKDFSIDAVITVPAYFGDEERQATKCAGYLAGLNVIGIINEPTAAALTYGISINENKKIMVFDLGGGTFDTTILDVTNGDFNVIATDGNVQLGGKNWDEVIQSYIRSEFKRITNSEISDERFWEIQEIAIEKKKVLSIEEETIVTISENGNEVELKLFRQFKGGDIIDIDDYNLYFEQKCSHLLDSCSSRCSAILEKKNLTWDEIDEIVLAGGSCRMPMVYEMLEKISGKKIKTHREGFSYDTAIAIGAAIYGQSRGRIIDVAPKSIGVKILRKDDFEIDHLIYKNSSLPAKVTKKYMTDPYAILELYEGESKDPSLCEFRGKLELENTTEHAIIQLEVDADGILKILADYQPQGVKETKISGSSECSVSLKEKIQAINIIS